MEKDPTIFPKKTLLLIAFLKTEAKALCEEGFISFEGRNNSEEDLYGSDKREQWRRISFQYKNKSVKFGIVLEKGYTKFR